MNVSKISQMFCLLMVPGAGMASAVASGRVTENFSVMQPAGKMRFYILLRIMLHRLNKIG
jgi:hypothetical protein